MTLEQITIISPPIDFPGTPAGSAAANSILYPENWIPPSVKLPNPMYIRRVELWDQSLDYLGHISGDVSIGIDPGKQYVLASGFPVAQNTEPMYEKSLCTLEYLGANSKHESFKDFDPPVCYRPHQDGLIFAPQMNNATGTNPVCSIFVLLCFEATGDLAFTPETLPTGASWVYQSSNDTSVIGNDNISIRNLIPPIAAGGTQVRAHFSAGGNASILNHASIGIQSGSTSSTTSTPVELTFNGGHGVTIPANTGVWSDWVNLSTTAGQSLLVTTSLFSGAASNNWHYKRANGDGNWSSSSDSWNTVAMQGSATWQASKTHSVDRVQVK